MNNTKKAELHKKTLKKGEEDFFIFEANLNTSCSLSTNKVNIDFYLDERGQCYIKVEQKTSNVCLYCTLEVNIYEGNKRIGNLIYWYPFSEGGITLGGKVPKGNSCLNYETAKNKTELKILPNYNIKFWVFDPTIGCIRGDIEKWWCEKYFPGHY